MKKQTAVQWLSNRSYELFEEYSEGKIDRITLNKLMLEATDQAKEMEMEQSIEFAWECQEMFKHEIKEHFEEKFNHGGNK